MITALIPCYNVERYCEKVVRDTLPYVSRLILVDDGSKDATGKILQRLAKEYPSQITLITFAKNQGKGFGLLAGFQALSSHPSILVALDGDGQHDPSFIPALVKAIEEGADLAIGTRQFEKMPPRRKWANSWMSLLLRLAYSHAPRDTQSGMRSFRYSFIEEMMQKIKGGHYEMELQCLLLALKEKKTIAEVPISTIYIEENRSSHFSPLVDTFKILWVFLRHLVQR